MVIFLFVVFLVVVVGLMLWLVLFLLLFALMLLVFMLLLLWLVLFLLLFCVNVIGFYAVVVVGDVIFLGLNSLL